MKNPKPPLSYLLALVFCGLAFSVAWPLDAPSSCFMLAIMATRFFAGRRPAWLAVLIATCIFELHFLPPAGHLMHSPRSFVRLGLFVSALSLAIAMIEARQRSERIRLQLDQDFLALAETRPDCILFLDAEHRILSANPALTSIFGYTRTEVLGQPATLILPTLKLGDAPSGEFTLPHKNGDLLDIDVTSAPLGDKTTLILRDISERKLALKQLEESELNLRLTLETIPGNVFTRSPNGQVEYASTRLTEYLGKEMKDVLGSGWLDGLHPDDKESALRTITREMALGRPYTVDYRRRRHDGVYRWFNATVRPLRDPTGTILRWYGLLTDIEDRLQMEESLRATQARLAHATQVATVSELAAAIVHEISQPLSAMVANGHAALRWLSASPPNLTDGRAAVDRIVRDGRDAAEIVKGLRTLFRHAPLDRTELDLTQIVAEVLSLLRAKADQEDVSIELELPDCLPHILGDKIQLQQVLMNLVSNGIESMQKLADPNSNGTAPSSIPLTVHSHRLTIRMARCGPDVLTSIEDHGTGVSSFDTIFEPFFTTKERGMGMGLAICRSIVEAHHGKLWGEPAPISGSIFSFTIPLLEGSHA